MKSNNKRKDEINEKCENGVRWEKTLAWNERARTESSWTIVATCWRHGTFVSKDFSTISSSNLTRQNFQFFLKKIKSIHQINEFSAGNEWAAVTFVRNCQVVKFKTWNRLMFQRGNKITQTGPNSSAMNFDEQMPETTGAAKRFKSLLLAHRFASEIFFFKKLPLYGPQIIAVRWEMTNQQNRNFFFVQPPCARVYFLIAGLGQLFCHWSNFSFGFVVSTQMSIIG